MIENSEERQQRLRILREWYAREREEAKIRREAFINRTIRRYDSKPVTQADIDAALEKKQ